MLFRPSKRFGTTCGVPEMIAKIWIPAETCSGRAKIQIIAIISETLQVVLKRFQGRTNISLMFLFPWLDWGIDISDFEKIDFLGHGRFLAFSAPCKSDFLTWAIILRAPLKVPRVKILKNFFSEIFKKFLKFRKIYFGHPTTTQSLRNRFFGQKSRKKS